MNCIPPWLSSHHQCNQNITTYNTTDHISTMIQTRFIKKKVFRKLTEVQTKCQNPCKKIVNKVSLLYDEVSPQDTDIVFSFKQTVRVEKKVVVYSWFNFIVDVGSSLGLWLGLSALGITDLAIQAFLLTKQWLSVKLHLDSMLSN